MSQFTPAERAQIFARVAAALEPTASERQDKPRHMDGSDAVSDADAEPRWPRPRDYRDLRPARSLGQTDAMIAEERALAAERKANRERERAESEQRKQQLMTAKTQAARSWNEWCDAKIRDALDEHDATRLEAVAVFVAEVRQQLRDEFAEQLAALKVELTTRSDNKGVILDLPALPSRRRHDAA